VLITRGFPYAADGIAIVMLAAGTRADIRDELIPGLAAEGWIDTGAWHPPPAMQPEASSGPDDVTPLALNSNPDGALVSAKPAQRRR